MRRWVWVLVSVAVGVGPVRGQEGSAGGGLSDEIIARAVQRVALMDMRLLDQPQPEDYAVCGALLGIAQGLLPEDEEIVRQRLLASFESGDEAGVLELTRRIMDLDPKDTVAQLRYITTRIGARQTVEDRVAAYERFLDAGRGSLDASVRSSLALDLALLLRERGDEAGFVDAVTRAVALDSTNKEAATLALSYYSERVRDPGGRLELLGNLLLADPLDPNVHVAIARELVVAGAYEEADRFFDNAESIILATGAAQDENFMTEQAVMYWHVHGPQETLDELTTRIDTVRHLQAHRLEVMRENEQSTEDEATPEELRLPLSFDLLRIMSASVTGDVEARDVALAELKATMNEQADALKDPEKLPPGINPQQAALMGVRVAVELQLFRLWMGVELEDAIDQFEAIREVPAFSELFAGQLGGWVAVRTQQAQVAVDLLEDQVEAGDRRLLALGEAYLQLERQDDAAAVWRRVLGRSPLTPEGVWARERLQSKGYSPYDSAGVRARAVGFAASVPGWVDRMCRSPKSFMSLTAEWGREDAGRMGTVVVRLRNLSPIPLALGVGATVNSRVMLSAKLHAGLEPIGGALIPEVIDLKRRLRLNPGESVTVTVAAGQGLPGFMADLAAGDHERVRWRAIQGFRYQSGKSYQPGPLCLATETEGRVLPALQRASWEDKDLAEAITGADEDALVDLVAALRAKAGRTGEGGVANVRASVAALRARYPGLSARARLFVAAAMPNGSMIPELKPLDEAVLGEVDPAVLPVVLVTRVGDADAEALGRGSRSPEPGVSALASNLRKRLESGLRGGYARHTLGVKAQPTAAADEESSP